MNHIFPVPRMQSGPSSESFVREAGALRRVWRVAARFLVCVGLLLGVGLLAGGAEVSPEFVKQFFSKNIFPDPDFEVWEDALPKGWWGRDLGLKVLEERHEERRVLEIQCQPEVAGFGLGYQLDFSLLRSGDVLGASIWVKGTGKGAVVLRILRQYTENEVSRNIEHRSQTYAMDGTWQKLNVSWAVQEAEFQNLSALFIQIRGDAVNAPLLVAAPVAWCVAPGI
ncbi:MAG: hypothetical protein HYV27_20110 [Candidatus Hydrogenedentes bacterium]|nr:hypothetical protein [Candidatus Hydrogenedentota bacterium]